MVVSRFAMGTFRLFSAKIDMDQFFVAIASIVYPASQEKAFLEVLPTAHRIKAPKLSPREIFQIIRSTSATFRAPLFASTPSGNSSIRQHQMD